mmetsp:Transcript_44228/g.133996  ORF Transcript_44228/g.133996 Transcript_44228/m.133996 type:complete len:225 (+) Transcript_44228:546-1220(+)
MDHLEPQRSAIRGLTVPLAQQRGERRPQHPRGCHNAGATGGWWRPRAATAAPAAAGAGGPSAVGVKLPRPRPLALFRREPLLHKLLRPGHSRWGALDAQSAEALAVGALVKQQMGTSLVLDLLDDVAPAADQPADAALLDPHLWAARRISSLRSPWLLAEPRLQGVCPGRALGPDRLTDTVLRRPTLLGLLARLTPCPWAAAPGPPAPRSSRPRPMLPFLLRSG